MTKNRLEAFSDGMFAIIITLLILELKVPQLETNSLNDFLHSMKELLPKFLSFIFTFFLLSIFWVNHHNILHKLEKVDIKLLWMNILFLFFSSLFPFIAAFIGDYPLNPYVVALYPLNMLFAGLVLRKLWKYAFVDTNLAPNTMSEIEKKRELHKHDLSALINLVLVILGFVWLPITIAIIMLMPLFFVFPDLRKSKE
ncbi:MAG: DUF1211 domain-containing protein [Bacteroidales bacterium]|nr:DUF1211 domain-containing protein [Bacteroidales bacterium]